MSSRKRPEQESDPIASSNKRPRFDINRLLPGRDTTRPSTPSATNTHGTSRIGEHPDEATDVGSHIQQSTQPLSQTEDEILKAASTSTDWKKISKGLGSRVTDVLKVGPLQDIADLVQRFADMGVMNGKVKTEYEALQQRLQKMLGVLDKHSEMNTSPKVLSIVQGIRESIEKEIKYMEDKRSSNHRRMLYEAEDQEQMQIACYRRIQEYLDELLLGATLEVSKLEENQLRNQASSLVRGLPSSSSAWYNSNEGYELRRRGCTEDTRVEVLAQIRSWINGNKSGVYWINGMAGTGKTTIAYTVCRELDNKGNLAASFFCSRQREDCRNVNTIIPSIAYQLARRCPPFELALSAVLENNPDIYTKQLPSQFSGLIREPLLAVGALPADEMVVVIDALDECDSKESTRDILRLLCDKATDLPIKFIVSSRPEPQIRDELTREQAKSRLVLHELDKGKVQADIEKYLQECLAPMRPSVEQIAALVEKAGILFIYAATAVRYIGYDNFQSDPEGRLGDVLGGPQSPEDEGSDGEIDQLYMAILEGALGNRSLRPAQRDEMRHILHTVICAREPLTVKGLSGLLGIKEIQRVRAALRPLWSVLHIVGANELVTTLHASFPEFMSEPKRSRSFYCDSNAHHHKLAELCLKYIAQTEPQFNICRLDSSYLPDDEVPNLQKQIAELISPELLYACRYWADHCRATNCPLSVVKSIRDFLSKRLLLWMEVLSLTGYLNTGMECAKAIGEWCKAIEGDQEFVELAHDAKRFVETFASNPVSRSTPHIYVSMLTFWPRSAPVANHYAKYMQGPVEAQGAALDRRQLAHLSTWAFKHAVGAIDVSPDGLYLAVATGNDVVVVDSSSGRVVIGPLIGHRYPDLIKAVGFSPDGSRVLAGSIAGTPGRHSTIVGWETSTGDTVLGPLRLDEHTSWIDCLSFSSDCSRIATGSRDETARLWNAETGQMLHRFEAHDNVNAAVFSSNGTQLAIAAGKTLHRWDTYIEQSPHAPVTHAHKVHTIAYSPDQTCIISCSLDSKDIRVCNALSGDLIRLLQGHSNGVTCIGYSPDGRYIVSGSKDRTVRVWDAHTGNMVLGPLEAHTNPVSSVAFSPDGSRVISTCFGGLVCTWDARQRTLTSSSHTHLDPITCVKFSSDGTRFVTGSTKGTICIWDAHTGEMVLGPIKVHKSQIKAVDFKNDRVVAGSDGGVICVCDTRSGQVVLGPLQVSSAAILAISYFADGNLIATGSSRVVDVWDGQGGSRILGPLTELRNDIRSVQFSPDGTRIVASSGGFSAKVVVWDVSDGRNVFGTFKNHRGSVYSVSYSPNGALIASGSSDSTIILQDAYTGKKVIGPPTGHSDTVFSVSFSPDSTRLVSGSIDITIRIWDVRTGEMVFQLRHGHESAIRSVEYSPEGTRILSRSDDMSVRIHDARSPEERARSRSESEVGDWTIDKDGWVGDDQSRLLVWVPGDLRKALMWSETRVVIAPQGYVRLKFDKSRMGESWERSYTSNM